MTILGDSSQSVNPYSSSSLEEINKVFTEADCVELCKSYRSTFEITNFAQKIQKNKKLIPIERHGEEPTITLCANKKDEFSKIKDSINDFLESSHGSLGIICKTQAQANEIYEAFKGLSNNISLLNGESKEFKNGIIITPAFIAKGLEFDNVFVAGAEENIFPGSRSIMDPADLEEERRLAYVAFTRAKKLLYITHAEGRMLFGSTTRNPLSRFVKDIPEELIEFKSTREQTRPAPRVKPAEQKPVLGVAGKPHAPKATPSSETYKPGDQVIHDTFGRGVVTSAKSMGADCLLEIAFDDCGTKRIMANFARLKRG
jgi:superfamily I DNA/RNA helicase